MSKIHFVLQGKGGVGKSLIASLLAQFKNKDNCPPKCIDTDPLNSSFAGYKSLDVQVLNILVNDEINARKFDELIEQIANLQPDQDMIVDNGASSFVPLSNYIIQNGITELIQELGHEVVVHTVVTGGQALKDTVNGFSTLMKQYPDSCQFVVWLNPYWGEVEFNGKGFESMKAYTDSSDKISSLIYLPDYTTSKMAAETYGADFTTMLKNKKTFDESITDENLHIMSRHRLKKVKEKIFDQLESSII